MAHCLGGGGLFQKAPKSCLIPWNGSLALKFFPRQPQKRACAAVVAFSAYPVEFPEGNPIQQGGGDLNLGWLFIKPTQKLLISKHS